jgi:predicted short-subunit dehydrogenase-like oxidoreductase (DUF2520 family)
MPDYYNVSFVGSGNMVWHLARVMEDAGHHILEIAARNEQGAKSILVRLYDAQWREDLDFTENPPDILILGVSDDAIEEIARELIIDENTLVAHCSGAVEMGSLEYSGAEQFGVIYPLQTLSKGRTVDFKKVPILIEGNSKSALKKLKSLGKSISNIAEEADSEERKRIHLAAVFASNFVTYMLQLSDKVLDEAGFNLEILRPLLAETLSKVFEIGPKAALTGPARRKDKKTMAKHLALLEPNSPEFLIYNTISELIVSGQFRH